METYTREEFIRCLRIRGISRSAEAIADLMGKTEYTEDDFIEAARIQDKWDVINGSYAHCSRTPEDRALEGISARRPPATIWR